jgi:hypothetical protein
VLAYGTFFPPCYYAVPWGRASVPAGVAPKVLEERECSCKVFPHLVSVRGVSAGLGSAMRTYRHSFVFGACPGGVAVRRALEPGPARGDRGELSGLFMHPSPPLRVAEG